MLGSAAYRIQPLKESAAPSREIDVLRGALAMVARCLPSGWRWEVEEDARRGEVVLDALVTLTAPDGSEAVVAVEAKRLVATRDVPGVLEQLRASIDRGAPWAVPMVVARYLSPATRERLTKDGAAYADATGNARLAIDSPALFVRDAGEDRDPWRGPGRPRGTLKGAAAARVVRALADFAPPYSVPRLVELSGASTGAAYRVVRFLEEEDLVGRQPRGPITRVDWRRIIERWSADYGFQRSEWGQGYLFPRGVEQLPEALRRIGEVGYVLTGSLAAASLAPYAPARAAMLHADDIEDLARRLALRPADRGANVLVAASEGDVAFIRTRTVDGVVMAAPSQTAFDLLTGPGRSPSEGQAVLDWMEDNEPRWRQ